jgi:hypothetical protein
MATFGKETLEHLPEQETYTYLMPESNMHTTSLQKGEDSVVESDGRSCRGGSEGQGFGTGSLVSCVLGGIEVNGLGCFATHEVAFIDIRNRCPFPSHQ